MIAFRSPFVRVRRPLDPMTVTLHIEVKSPLGFWDAVKWRIGGPELRAALIEQFVERMKDTPTPHPKENE